VEPAEAKEALRREVIATRRDVPLRTRQVWSETICRRICESSAFGETTHLVAYHPIGAEVDPTDAAANALREGRHLYYPVSDGQLEVRREAILGDDEVTEASVREVLTLDDARVLFLVPGVAFDDTGGRVGRGRGWYDRLLARFHRARRWGLAYDLQVVAQVPRDPWDLPMDVVLTERRRIESKQSLMLPEGTG
jgi:5-formyltetrahydrofolate cyclo-ligase